MSLLKFIDGIRFTTFERKHSTDLLESSANELTWLAGYLKTAKEDRVSLRDNDPYKGLGSALKAQMPASFKERELDAYLIDKLPAIISVSQYLTANVEKYFESRMLIFNDKSINTRTMTYMRAVSHLDYLSKNLGRWVRACMMYSNPIAGVSMSPGEIDALKASYGPMAVILKAYTQRDVISRFENMEDCMLTDNKSSYEFMVATYGPEKVDPLFKQPMTNFVPTIILSVRFKMAEYRAERYHQHQQLKTTLESRLAYLKTESSDASVEQQIVYEEERLKSINNKLLMMEEAIN